MNGAAWQFGSDHLSANAFLPLGDQAALVYLATEAAAWRFASLVRQANDPSLVDVVQAYTSVAVFFSLDKTTYAEVVERLRMLFRAEAGGGVLPEVRFHRIPCCYDFQLDLPRVSEHTRLSAEEIIRLHRATEYTVYAIGFCPGFPYLGYLPAALSGVPRLPAPRLRVAAGSVGLTGKQTGIYPLVRPGGWNLIGRTPLQLVDIADNYFPLKTGDRVVFERIDETRYRQLLGERIQ